MSAIAGDVIVQPPPGGRRIAIEALDGSGGPAAAQIDVLIDGAPAGRLDLGTGRDRRVSLEVSDAFALIDLRARFLTETQAVRLPPGQDLATFRFSATIRFAAGKKPVAYCPDGTSGSPCVTCHGAGGKSWRMCC